MKGLISVVVSFSLMLGTLVPTAFASPQPRGEKRMFTITGYYSPLPNQNFYVTGDYLSEKRLNGHGIAGADGTPVFPGMIAAPRSYAFGTKIYVPGMGYGAVHDRGGAIVEKGQRDLARHDRLDIWMGYGEEGLLRALAWGVQHLECEIFGDDQNVRIGMDFEVPPMLHQILDLPDKKAFEKNLAHGAQGEAVKALQRALITMEFYRSVVHGIYDYDVEAAVFAFQRKHFIVEEKTDIGAGVFGPKTRAKLASALYDHQVQQQIREAWESFRFEENLKQGARNQAALKLQQILVAAEIMDVHPTGYFGPKTKEALIAFQLQHAIIDSANQVGAGRVGPQTRDQLNRIIEEKSAARAAEKTEVLAYTKQRNRMAVLAERSDILINNFVQR